MAKKILIVDDDVVIRDLLLTTLEFSDHDISHAADGPSAIARFQERPADVVILDLDLPAGRLPPRPAVA